MKVVGYQRSLPISDADALINAEMPKPKAKGRDLLVAVRAISVNPVDFKVRLRAAPPEGEIKILGWDAAGVVEAVGEQVSLFKPGDKVFYAGALQRQGTNSEFHLVDERIVGRMPKSLGFAGAAALPLTSITAWELLFDRLGIARAEKNKSLFVIGGAGGVGSIMIQLAKKLTGLTVIATASRPETQSWVRDLGADISIDHTGDMPAQLKAHGIANVDYIASLTHTDKHFDVIAALIAPQGKIGVIDDPDAIDVRKLKQKSASLHWELMFTRSMFETPDMIAQHHLLNEVSRLVDEGVIRTTVAEHFGTINATNLKSAHALLQSGKSRGKIVLEGF